MKVKTEDRWALSSYSHIRDYFRKSRYGDGSLSKCVHHPDPQSSASNTVDILKKHFYPLTIGGNTWKY